MATNFDTRLAGYHSPVLSAFRIIFGLLYMLHGSHKAVRLANPGAGADRRRHLAVLVGRPDRIRLGLLITLGLFTRIAAFIASGEMAFAYF